jgi:hypothetical protein
MGPDGLIKIAAANSPRFDHSYNSATGEIESLGLLIEEARTNLITRSEDFSHSSWTKSQSSVALSTLVSPRGDTTSVYKLIENDTNGGHSIWIGFGLPSTTTYTFSVFLKAGERTKVDIRGFNSTNGNQFLVKLDLTNGTVLENSGGIYGVQSYSNGWYKFYGVGSFNNIFTQFFISPIVSNLNASDTSYQGDGTSGIYIWGAQLEAGAFPTSYIPTTASTVTRTADSATMTGSNFSSWYNFNEGTMFAEYSNGGGIQNRYPFAISDNTTNNRITIFNSGSTSLNPRVTASGGGFNPGPLSVFTTGMSKVAISVVVTTNGAIAASNGTLSSAASPTAMPVVDRAYIGLAHQGAEPLNGVVKRLTYYPTRLPNNILQNLTR